MLSFDVMKSEIGSLLFKKELTREDIVSLLRTDDESALLLFREASTIKTRYLGNSVYLRGLVEYSNICGKNCLYCGIRKDNKKIKRYSLTDDEVFEAAITAWKQGFGSVILQGGELESQSHSDNIEHLIHSIRKLTNNEIGIALSLGEQDREVYQRWFEAGAHCYLLKIEASGKELYEKAHPGDGHHEYDRRHECLRMIKDTGYQTGTGIMVGLPHQTLYDLADDIIFMRDFDIDLCCMGPFIEHTDTPLGGRGINNYFLNERFELTLRMTAILRIIMKDINIVASTAMQAIDRYGREKAILAGANVITPNLTPLKYRKDYTPYENKMAEMEPDPCDLNSLSMDLLPGLSVYKGKWGNAPHYNKRRNQVLQ